MSTHAEIVAEMPFALSLRPRDSRGYPIPWFTPIIDGVPDFRIVPLGQAQLAVKLQCCWICGTRLRLPCAYVVGPMCAVNRVSAEPPSHMECAIYAAKACPFLARPQLDRAPKPDGATSPGMMIERNPGVACVWITESPSYVVAKSLFDLGDPLRVRWYYRSRKATRAEVLASIESGLPVLREVAEAQEGGTEELESMLSAAMELVPAQ